MEKLKLYLVAHEPYGTWLETPVNWSGEAIDVFEKEVVEAFGRAEYWKGRQGFFFKEWDPCALVEEMAVVLHEGGVDSTLSATVHDDQDPDFCRHVTVTCGLGGCDLVEIVPVSKEGV